MEPRRPSVLYRVQGAVLDQLGALGYADRDGFAVSLADLYLYRRQGNEVGQFLNHASRIKTSTFAPGRGRREATRLIVERLDKKFLRELSRWQTPLPASPTQEVRLKKLHAGAKRLGSPGSQQFDALLREFRKAIQLLGPHQFWHSRARGILREKPESTAQLALSMFLHSPVKERDGLVLTEVRSGTGYVDVMATFGRSRTYVVELKILRSARVSGLNQLAEYLELHSLSEGWLLLFDTRRPRGRTSISDYRDVIDGKRIRVIVVDINPPAPSSLG